MTIRGIAMNKREPLVSVVTPCFNSEKYIDNFLKSLLNQSYKKLEVILVDDGSTDNTAAIIQKYKQSFEQEGMKMIYVYQEHENQAQAVNRGLKYVTGEYLIWPDSDDVLESELVEQNLFFLENHSECGMVRADFYYVDEETGKKTPCRKESSAGKTQVFEDLLFEKAFICSGRFMIRMSSFLQVYPEREIYVCNAGQNYQMVLPIAYNYPCGHLQKALYGYVRHRNSHSAKRRTYRSEVIRAEELLDICKDALKRCDVDDETYHELIKRKKKQFNELIIRRHPYDVRTVVRRILNHFY